MNHKWNYQPITPEQAETSQTLAQELGISPILGQLLVQRGITKAGDAKKFFRPQLPDLHDPFLMKDMDIAVERLNKAMGKKERILIYGDYDVDGTTAVALVYKFIQQFYSNIDYYIPDRYNEGYGISKKGVDYASETGVGLICPAFSSAAEKSFSVRRSTASLPFWMRPDALIRGPILNTISLTVISFSESPHTSMMAFMPTLGLLFSCFRP